MGSIDLHLPESLYEQARKLAKREDISIDQLTATALAEKMAALLTCEYLAAGAGRGSRRKFELVLRKVRARKGEPVEGDEL